MKKFLLAFALLIGIGSFYNTTEAQSINISINIGRQPAWGPVGYDYVGYYYFPDIDCYYDVNVGLFYYLHRGHWVSARYLPYGYRNYDLYGMYKVVLNVHEPWRYHRTHYRDYARYKGYRNQIVIRDSRDYRYRDSRNNRVAWYSDSKSHRDNGRKYTSNNRSEYRNDNKNSNRNKVRENNNRNTYKSDNNRTKDRKDNANSNRNSNYKQRDSKQNNSSSSNNRERVNRSNSSQDNKNYRTVSNTTQRRSR
ncbi:MAG: hypothetical protein E6767_06945 [Dysgonomonas sp.]|nr:hypothetical protein [Dysgonomonas sp.]